MSDAITKKAIWEFLNERFPNACCELNYHNIFELAVSVILSAQTTDKSVNNVTPALFSKYPTPKALSLASKTDVEDIIKKIGLYKNKAQNIIAFSEKICTNFLGEIPSTIEELITLPGVGRKTANVIISEGYHIPGLAVDTHVERVSKRLGLVEEAANPQTIEFALKAQFPEELWYSLHHRLLFMGRYLCTARNPQCLDCPFNKRCHYHSKI